MNGCAFQNMRRVGQDKAVTFSGSFDGLDVVVSVRGPAERLPEIQAFAAALSDTAEDVGLRSEAIRTAVLAA